MKRRKKHLTSKALSLRLAVIALLLLLLPCLLGLYTPFATQVITQQEKQFATGPLEILDRQDTENYRAYLTGNEHSLNILFCRFSPLMGWNNYGGTTLDLSQENNPVWAGNAFYNGNKNLEDGEFYDNHLFGQVDVEGAESVRILYPEWEGSDPIVLPLRLGEDGRRYFWGWHTFQWGGWDINYWDIDVEVLDSSGNVLYIYETTPSYTEEALAG